MAHYSSLMALLPAAKPNGKSMPPIEAGIIQGCLVLHHNIHVISEIEFIVTGKPFVHIHRDHHVLCLAIFN